jgi:hypothetical protein
MSRRLESLSDLFQDFPLGWLSNHDVYQAEPLQQQINQPTMEIETAVAANDNSEQTAKENNTHS